VRGSDMSRRSYSKHVPDFRFITHFAETGSSPVHRMNPWTKIALLFFVVAFATVLTEPLHLTILFAATLLFYASGRLPIRVLIGWFTFPVMFVLTIAIMFVFTEPGTDLARFDVLGMSVGITDQGVLVLAKLVVRALAVVTFSLTVFMTTKYAHVAHMMHRTMPGHLATVFLLSYRFMFVTTDEVTDVLDAMHSRNGSLAKGVARQTGMFAGIFGLAFVHAFERAERIAKAMESRGFTGKLPVADSCGRPSAMGYALVMSSAVLLALAAYARYFDPVVPGWW